MIICRRQCRRIDARFSQLYFCSADCQLLLRNCAMDFAEIWNVCTWKVIIKAAKRIFNSDKICRSYCDFYFGVTFGTHCIYILKKIENIENIGYFRYFLKYHDIFQPCKWYTPTHGISHAPPMRNRYLHWQSLNAATLQADWCPCYTTDTAITNTNSSQ